MIITFVLLHDEANLNTSHAAIIVIKIFISSLAYIYIYIYIYIYMNKSDTYISIVIF